MWYTYILKSVQFGKYYIGYTENLENRLKWHNEGKSKWSKRFRPWVVAHKEEFSLKTEAIKREKQLKRYKSRNYIEKLIANFGPVV